MSYIEMIVDKVHGYVWGVPLIAGILVTGLILTCVLRFTHIFNLKEAFRIMFSREEGDGVSGEVSQFGALCTALSATIGTGNIVGVATAIGAGGPGALFWMEIAAFFGMATKYAEGLLAVKYREVTPDGRVLGGPFYYIENGLGRRWKWLAVLFAFFGVAAGIMGIGTITQINGITSAVQRFFDPSFNPADMATGISLFGTTYSVATVVSGVVVTVCVALVVIGGLKRIAKVSTVIVPFMAIFYLLTIAFLLLGNLSKVTGAIELIVKAAFNPAAFTGGVVGTVFVAIQNGVARGIFSNEAGLGSAPIAAAAARTNEPARQGLVCMTGTFIDTIVICTMTGLAIVVTGAWDPSLGLKGVDITIEAFSRGLSFLGPNSGSIASFFLMTALAFFAYTTILGWDYYSEKCLEYLVGSKRQWAVKVFRVLYVAVVFVGPYLTVSAVWGIADVFNGLMAFPNLVALLLLSPVVWRTTKSYLSRRDSCIGKVATSATFPIAMVAVCAALPIEMWADASFKNGVFLSPRHSQVAMKGEWYPELVGGRGGAKYHWFSEKKGESVSLEFEGTSVSVVARTGARLTWRNTTHTNSLARLGVFTARIDGKSVSPISLAGSAADARSQPERSERTHIAVARGLAAGRHVLELVNDGSGTVEVVGFIVDRPQKGAEPDFSKESPELAREVPSLPPILFVEGAPIHTVAGPCLLGHSAHPFKGEWGTAIKVFDPSKPNEPPRTLFEESDSAILDLALTHDAKTILFSMRRHKSPCWHIYRIGVDGKELVQLTDGNFHDTSPASLADGRIAFISTRAKYTHLVCASGPSSRVHVMNGDGTGVKMISSNTLADYSLSALDDGRLLYTRWEYVDWNIMSRQSLWTQYPDGRHLELWFGNLLDDPPNLLQARQIPDEPEAAVCTFAPHHGSPFGAIGVVSTKNGPEGRRGAGVRWLTQEYPSIMDFNHIWSYCWPYPLGGGRYLCSYSGGAHRYRLALIDEQGRRATVYTPSATGAFCATPLRPRRAPKIIADFKPEKVKSVVVPAAPPGQPEDETVQVGYLYVTDVMRGQAGSVPREDVKAVRIMEQIPKTVALTGPRAYDQTPLMGVGTYYAKRVWGYALVEKDGSAYFEVPAMKEIYLQLVDADGREIQRMTSALNVVPGERRSCAGCHEGRTTASGVFAGEASRRAPSPLSPPKGMGAGIVNYMRDVQPVWNRHCVQCHGGTAPAKGLSLEDGRTRFFCRSYDGLNERARSDRESYLQYAGAPGAGKRKPLIHSILLNYGFADVLRPRQTGTYASRLPDYLDRKHCGSDVTPEERRRIYEWIDAMVPYYTTTDCAHLQARGKRDRWGDPDTSALAPWVPKYAGVFARSCARCHGALNPGNTGIWGDKRWEWVDLTRPELSPALVAHLPKSAGGRGLPTRDMAAFSGRDDPLWLELFSILREAAAHAAQTPEPDESGFVPRSRGRLEYSP